MPKGRLRGGARVADEERGRDLSMPSPIHIDPLLNLIDQETQRSRVAAVHFALDRYCVFTMNRYRAETAAYDALPSSPPSSSVVMLTPPVRNRDAGAGVYDDIAAGWVSASLYEYDCCHYTDRGYQLLAEVIAGALRQTRGPMPRVVQ